jgi:hypothetical protein
MEPPVDLHVDRSSPVNGIGIESARQNARDRSGVSGQRDRQSHARRPGGELNSAQVDRQDLLRLRPAVPGHPATGKSTSALFLRPDDAMADGHGMAGGSARSARGTLIARLRERGVLRVAASYAVIAWLVLQIADVALEP